MATERSVDLPLRDDRRKSGRFVADLRGLIRETVGPVLAVGFARAGVAIAQIISVRVSTQLLTPVQMGGVSQMASLAYFCGILLTTPVGHYINRGFLEWYDTGRLQEYLKRYFAYLGFAAFAAAAAAGGVQSQWHLVSGFKATAVAVLIGLYMLSSPVNTIGITGLNLLHQRIRFALFSNLPVWVALAASPILFMRYGDPAFWSLGQYVGLAVGCLSCWVLWQRLNVHVVAPVLAQEKALSFSVSAVFRFSWPVMLTASLWWVQSQSYRFVLDRIQGVANVGLFAVGYSLAATPIATYEAIFAQFYEPIFYGELKGQSAEGQVRAWNNYARAYLPGLVIVGAFVAAGVPFLAQVLLGETFRAAAVQVAMWAAIVETMRASAAMMYHLGVAKIDTRINILPVAAGAVLAPLSVLILGQYDPLLGTMAGLFVAGLAVMAIIVVSSRRVLPIDWPIGRILLGLVLAVPLVGGFQGMHWLLPSAGTMVSLLMLTLGGIYLAAVQMWLFSHRERS